MGKAGSPTPERIFGTLVGYQTSSALSVAIQIELFTHVAAGADTLAALARATGASERGLRALCNHLAAHGLLEKRDGRYRCAPDVAEFLDRKSPRYLGTITRFLNGAALVRCFDSLVEAVKRGGTADRAGGTVAPSNPIWVDFARHMEPAMRAFARDLAEIACKKAAPKRVLDVAAGHGRYGIEVALRAKSAEVTFLDWENVLAVARENAVAAGIGERARYLAGSALEVDFGRGFDLVLVPHFLHHFERESCARVLAKARAALARGGRVAVLEFLVNEDRVTPSHAAAFDLVMLATTPRGEAYTVEEYVEMFTTAGLEHPERHDLADGAHTVLVARST